jgi:apolipoprotein N-acyltransferase
VKRAAAVAATALSAFAYALAFPPTRWSGLAWVALAPFLLALRAVGPWTALFLCWFWPVFASSFVADALPAAVESYFLQPPLVSLLFAIGVWTLTGSLYYMVFGPVYRALARHPSVWLPWLAAAAWAAAELARGRLLTGTRFFVGNPWALAAYSQAGSPRLLQIASATGVYGISFALVAVNAGVAELWLALRGRAPRRRALAALALACVPAGAVLAFGELSLRARDAERPVAAATPIAIVQGDVDVGSVWRSDLYGRNLEVYLALTRQARERGRPAVAFWPEAALTFFLEQEPLYLRAIARELERGPLELVVGGPRAEPGRDGIYYNTVFAIDPDGRITGRYDKQYLVPFSEHFPLRIDFLRRRFERVRVFEPGAPSPPLATRAGLAGMLVCNEAMLPEVARRRVLAGAEYLVSPSNDSWIRDAKWAELMFDMVKLRAVEERRYLVRASTSGPSAIVDPWGGVALQTPPMSREVVLGEIRPRREFSIYGRIGDLFGFACAASVGVVLVARALAAGRTDARREPERERAA